MDKETYEALKLLMEKLDRHVIHATYQEDTMKAYKQVEAWIDEVSKDYECNCGSSELPVWHSKSDCLNPY